MVLLFIVCMSVPANAQQTRQELSSQSTLEQVLQRGTLKVGFSTFVPWAMKDKTGKFIGFEIDVARRLAEDMGVEVQFIPTKWSGIIPALLTGKFDVIIGGMGILPKRNLKVNFTRPYEYSGMSLLANSEKAKGMTKLEDFNSKDVVLAVRMGATPVEAAKRYMPKAQLRLFDDEAQAVQEMLNGRAHAVVASSPLPAFTHLKYPQKTFLPLGKDTFTKEPIGFAVRKGDPDFMNFLNNWILVTESEGWLKDRYEYWFTTQDWKKLTGE